VVALRSASVMIHSRLGRRPCRKPRESERRSQAPLVQPVILGVDVAPVTAHVAAKQRRGVDPGVFHDLDNARGGNNLPEGKPWSQLMVRRGHRVVLRILDRSPYPVIGRGAPAPLRCRTDGARDAVTRRAAGSGTKRRQRGPVRSRRTHGRACEICAPDALSPSLGHERRRAPQLTGIGLAVVGHLA
jgi:hypothetical protein